MRRTRLFLLILLLVVAIAALAALLFQARLGAWIYDRAAGARAAGEPLAAGTGLAVGLCGTGSPMPGTDRTAVCTVVLAGKRALVIDIGEGGARNLVGMVIDRGRVAAVFLTHFHADHIDGLGPLNLLHWTGAASPRPLALIGPRGVEEPSARRRAPTSSCTRRSSRPWWRR